MLCLHLYMTNPSLSLSMRGCFSVFAYKALAFSLTLSKPPKGCTLGCCGYGIIGGIIGCIFHALHNWGPPASAE